MHTEEIIPLSATIHMKKITTLSSNSKAITYSSIQVTKGVKQTRHTERKFVQMSKLKRYTILVPKMFSFNPSGQNTCSVSYGSYSFV